ncbi:MAG: excinuclease ABC subunit UvrC [Thermoplasmatota archaeon]
MFPIDHLPNSPGCYIFKNERNQILYIGKAKNLRKRVMSYLHHTQGEGKTPVMLDQVRTVEFIATDTEVEALILENTLIKQHQPKYNIDLKDAKAYAYLRITNEPFPRILISRRRQGAGWFYGPFVSAVERDDIVQFLQNTFRFRTCNRLPKKPCLRHHIHLCDAPCISNISSMDYEKNISHAKQILSGNISDVVRELKAEMETYAKQDAFEQALLLRNQLQALQHLQERQNMQRQKHYDEDIINYQIHDNTLYLLLFNVYKGTLTNKHDFVFACHEDSFEEFLLQYYAENPIPKELIVPRSISEPLHSYIEQQKGSKVTITIPIKGEKKQLLMLAEKNIELTFFPSKEKIALLQQKLRLHKPPHIIECFDISHLSGTSMVGSMVQFRYGKPDKNNYRRFRIRTVEGVDDVAAIEEVVRRRYRRIKIEQKELPDLIIIDGGKGQLNRALEVLEEMYLSIPIIAIAKKFEDIYIPGDIQPLHLSQKDPALHYVQEIRDEAHRFAISYNRLLRTKDLIA